MAQNADPRILRIGINKDWDSKWLRGKDYHLFLEEDWRIRVFLEKKLAKLSVERVRIERSHNSLKVIIESAKPGLIIGRGGSGTEQLKEGILKIIAKFRKEKKMEGRPALSLEVMEIRKVDIHAAVIAENVASQLERRISFRRALKDAASKAIQNSEIEGIKIAISGRLGGAEMSRREWTMEGKIPSSTLRSDIDYAQKNAHTTYGVIGVKVWLYKGEIF